MAIAQLSTRHPTLSSYRYYGLLVHIFVVVLLISNLVAGKIAVIGPFKVSGALLLFPITYIFGDIFTEVYGYAGSRRAIWLGFFASALMALISTVIVALPPAPDWPYQQAYETVLGIVPRIIAASLIAYWAGEFANSFVMAKMKVLTGGRMLWTRTIGSTAIGQAVDTAIVITLTFAGRAEWGTIREIIVASYVAKVLYETAATPITYAVVSALKRAEGINVYDTDTNFNPFASEKNSSAEPLDPIVKAR